MTNAGGMPVDLGALPTTSPSLDAEPVLASWSKRVLASFLDTGIAAGATFLAFGDQFVTVPFTGAHSWTWTQTIIVEGVESQGCSAPV